MTFTTKQIIKKIGSDKLELTKNAGDGYWYFIYDNKAAGKFDTLSIYVMYLNDMSIERWVEEGKDFVAKMENEL